MNPTSTPTLPITEKQEAGKANFPETETPSQQTLDFILNYSKNLQISKSRYVSEIEIVKS